MAGIHDGHRQRMRARFFQHGLDSFAPHEVLELVLYYAVPRGDVNPLAHELIDRFGSLSAVLDAPYEELCRIKNVGPGVAGLLKLIPQVSRCYLISKENDNALLNDAQKAGQYMIPRFYARRDESVYMICLDARSKVLNCREMFRGSVNAAGVSVRKIVENALNYNATGVILAHNHTSGVALPSREDIETTRRIRIALEAVDIQLLDHIIVAGEDFVSLADSGILRNE